MTGMVMPYGPQHGGYPSGQPGVGRLVVDCSHPAMQFLLKATGPKIEINGTPQNVKWGPSPFNLPAGTYNVKVCTRYLGEFGPAYLPVRVMPGQVTTVYYRAPATMGMKGAIGFTPQKTPGINMILWLQIMVVIFAVFMILAAVLD
jgi:hypothetical protein